MTHSLHDRLALLLAGLVPLTALPLASNRAAIWLLWTALFAALALVMAGRALHRNPGWAPRILCFRLPVLLGFAVPVWAAVQILPLSVGGTGPISVQPDGAAAGILRLAGYFLLAALLLEVATQRERLLRMGYILFAGVAAQAIYALAALQLMGDVAPFGPKTAYQGAATGTFVNRNSLATFLGFGLVLGLGLLAERAQRAPIRGPKGATATGWPRAGDLFLLAGMGFQLVALVATQSRLGLAASLAALVVVAMLLRRDGTSTLRLWAEAGLICLALVGVVALLGAGGVADRLLLTASDGDSRLALYRQTLTMIAERPFTGWGMDAFATAFDSFRAPPLLDPVTYDLAHNTYLALWAEFGLVVGSAPIAALATIGWVLLSRLRAAQACPGLAAAALGALVLAGLHSLGDFSLEIPANAYLMTAILALGLGQTRSRPIPPPTATDGGAVPC